MAWSETALRAEVEHMFDGLSGHYDREEERLDSIDMAAQREDTPGTRYLEATTDEERAAVVASVTPVRRPELAVVRRVRRFLSQKEYASVRELARVGVSQYEIARRLGVTRITVYRILKGATQPLKRAA